MSCHVDTVPAAPEARSIIDTEDAPLGRNALRWLPGMVPGVSAVSAYAPPQRTEARFRQDMRVPADATVCFEEPAGKAITSAQFLDAMHGGSFSRTLDATGRTARFHVTDPHGKPQRPMHNEASLKCGRASRCRTRRFTPLPPASNDSRYTLLGFYFDACAPCITGMPALNAFAGKHPELRAAAATFDDAAQARAFQRQRHLEWPIVAGARDVIDALRVQAYPTLVLVRPNGTLATSLTGGGEQGRDPDPLAAWVRQAKTGMAT